MEKLGTMLIWWGLWDRLSPILDKGSIKDWMGVVLGRFGGEFGVGWGGVGGNLGAGLRGGKGVDLVVRGLCGKGWADFG